MLPAYRSRYLEDALKSILAQRYGSFRVVVSDDASTEPLKEIVSALDDPRVTFRRNPTNLGAGQLVTHWNLLLDNCASEYIIIASDDDLYHPGFLEQIDRLAQQHPEADILRTRACVIDRDGQVIRTEKGTAEWFSTGDFLNYLLQPESVLCIGNYVFKTNALKAAGGFVPFPLGWKSDSATQILLSRNGMPCTQDVLFSFRMSGLNISSRQEPECEKDRLKLTALIDFDAWLSRQIPAGVLEPCQRRIRNRLEGESRYYLWVLPFSGFRSVFRKFRKEAWFLSFRSQLSFVWCWIRTSRRG